MIINKKFNNSQFEDQKSDIVKSSNSKVNVAGKFSENEQMYTFCNPTNVNELGRENENSDKKKNSSKVRRAWLCSHIDKINYARGKCQNCYSNFYHKKPNCNILTKL